MLARTLGIGMAVAVVLLVLLLELTNPTETGPLGVLAVFVLMYVSVLLALTFLLYGLNRVIRKLSASLTVKKPLQELTLLRSYYFASVLALVPVMLIGMQSVGDVGIYEVILVILFALIATFYIHRRTG